MTPSTARTEPAPTPAGRAGVVDVGEIRAAIHAALNEGPPQRYDRLEALDAELSGHIRLLLPSAEAAVDELWHGSVEWDGRRARLDAIRYRLGLGLGDGLLSATVHVRHLARDCDALLDYLEAQR